MINQSSSLDSGGIGQPTPKEGWTIAEVTKSGRDAGVFRYRRLKPKEWRLVPLSEEVSITWKYEGSIPGKTTSMKMAEFEEALEPLSEAPNSKLVLVMTVGGLREWCYYTRDYDTFMGELNSCLATHPRFPIEIEHSYDPGWKYWHSFVDRLEAK